MAVMLMAKAFSMQVGNAGKKLVLLKLADNANDKGECWPSYQHIADQCEISKRSAMNYIDALIRDGLIEKIARKGPKGNSTNIYLLKLGGENAAPHSATDSPPSENPAPPSEQAAPGGSEQAAPGISHSFESVSESVSEPKEPCASSDAPPAEQSPAKAELYSGDFNRFWNAYPSKKGKKPAAQKFKAVRKQNPSPEFLDRLIEDVECRARGHEWTKSNGQFIPHAATYLSQERWNDPAPNVSQIQSRHNGFDERDYSEGLIEGVSDDAANF